MALDTTYGNGKGYERCPGYPKTKRSLQGRGSLAQIKTSHSDRFKVLMTSGDDIADIILRALPFKVGEHFLNPNGNTDFPTLLTEIDLSRDEKVSKFWYADLTFEEAALEIATDSNGNTAAPDQLTPEWSWGAETLDREWFIDADGNPIETSAGEQIGLTMPLAIPVLTIERYEPFFDSSVIIDFMNHRNSAPFWGADAGQVICASIEDRKDTHVVFAQQYYRRVKYVFKFAVPFIEEVLEGWKDILIDKGTYYLDSQGNPIHFKAGGSDTTGNLNGFGGKLAVGANPSLLEFWRFPEADFNDLALGPF